MFKDNTPASNACASHITNNRAKKRTKKGAARMLGLRVMTIIMTVSMVLSGDGVAYGTRAFAQSLSEAADGQVEENAASTLTDEDAQRADASEDDPPPDDAEENDQPSDNNVAGDDVQTPDDVEPQDAYEPQPGPEPQDAYEPQESFDSQYAADPQYNPDSQDVDAPQGTPDSQTDPAELPVDEPASDDPASDEPEAPVHNTLYGNVPVYLSFSMDGQQAEPRAVTVKLQLRMQTWDPAANAWSSIDEAGDNAGWADVLDETTGRPVTAHLDREAISQNVNASYADDDPTNDGAAFNFANQIVQTVLE
ncbi:MAG: hypothetical protein U0J70_13120, partial [Atopobiaceae bacterium]|nr:hypothetical protein [Atopobiaceae bacterium]